MAKNELSESEKIFIRLNENANTIFYCQENKITFYNDKHISFYKNEFESDFGLLYQISINDVFFWQFCRFEVYEKTIDERKKFFLLKFDDANNLSFYENELEILKGSYKEFRTLQSLERDFFLQNKPRPKYAVFSFPFLYKFNLPLSFLSNELKKKIDYTQIRKEEYIKSLILNLQKSQPEKQNIEEPENPHQRIFPNGKCWQLFEYWKDNAKDIKADLCFAYWKMIEDKLMYKITPTQFAEWLLEKLNFDFEGYWKQLDRVKTTNRNRLYSMAKLQFQLNKSQY